MELVVGSRNTGKIKELEHLLADLPITLRSLSDFQNISEPQETALTFAENAVLKAKSYALQTKLWALADDSGLEVKALNGAPGVFSARYGDISANDSQRMEKLLNELNEVGTKDRSARFVCAMAISDENGEIIFLTDGICNGKIASKQSGKNGCGYDPSYVQNGLSLLLGEFPNQ